MKVVIQKIWNEHNVISDLVGRVYETHLYDDSDICGIFGILLSAISEKDDLKISFFDEENE